MVAFPLAKLVYLGIKQVSKPIASQLKIAARHSPFFGKYICAPPAQALHRLEMFVKFRLMGAKGQVEYTPLSYEKSVEVGSEMFGEFFIYSVAAGIIFYEYWKSMNKDKERDETQDEQGESLDILNSKVILLEKQIEQLKMSLEQVKTTPVTSQKADSK